MSVSLHLGDAFEILRSLPSASVDAVVTDPPYGVALGSKPRNQKTLSSIPYASYQDTPENLRLLIARVYPELRRVAKRVILTPGIRAMWDWPKPDHVGAFFYPSATGCNSWGFSCWQPIFYYGKDPYGGKGSRPDSFQSTEKAEQNGHPCPKPIKKWTRLLERVTLPGETVLDPFAGSGTTAVACLLTGRNFIGCEVEPAYYDIARRRIMEAESLTPLLAANA